MNNITETLDQMISAERERDTAAGTGIAARRARYRDRRKQHGANACPAGHAYTEENTTVNAGGRRVCRACQASRRTYAEPLASKVKR